MPRKLTYEEVKEFIETNSKSKLLSKEYINNHAPLLLKCECGEQFERPFAQIKNRKHFICNECSKKLAHDKISFSYSQVKEIIESKGCTLLSSNYYNGNDKLKIQCSCGKIFIRSFHKFQAGQITCNKCSLIRRVKQRTLTYEQVKNYIESKSCKLLSKTYINSDKPLLILCHCGKHKFKRSFHKFQAGQINCLYCAKIKSAEAKIKYTEKEVADVIAKDGYKLIGRYKDAQTPVKCVCKRGHIFELKFSYYLQGHSGCLECSHIDMRGENHYNYKGGESEIIDFLRKNIKEWKKEVLKKYNYRCYITNYDKKETTLAIHHLKSFNTIIKETFTELNLEVYRKLKDYTQEQVESIRLLFAQKHIVDNGIVISRSIHDEFHKLYGKGDNTKEQFNEFLKIYYPNVKLL